MRYLVIGGGGFLGRRIVYKLLQRDADVVVLGRRDYPDLRELGARCLRGDVADPEIARLACRRVDVVFHTAAKVGAWGPRREFQRTNVDGARAVIDACRREGVRKLIYTSSPSVVFGREPIRDGDESLPYPADPLSHYQRTKAEAERLVLAANGPDLMTCALRPHAIWGVGDQHLLPRLIAAARAGRLKIVGDGENRISMIHVQNAAAAHVQAADSDRVGGKAYFVNEPEPVNLWHWVNGILEELGLPPARKRVPYRAAYRVGAVLEGVHTLLPFLGEPRLTRYVASLLATDHYFRTDRAQADFGFKLEIAPRQARLDLIHHLAGQGGGELLWAGGGAS